MARFHDISPPEQPGFGVYIHWPFCAAKCPYCDFNSHVRAGGIDERRFLKAYLSELDYMRAFSGGREINSIFFGGGTPSLMSAEIVGSLIDHIAGIWSLEEAVEITLEANPTSVEAAKFAGYRKAGVNRLSLGVQSLRDRDLKRLGRLHSAGQAREALEIARRTFDRISFDMIYGRPGQSEADWSSELNEALDLGIDHLSLYQLTIEPGTPFAALEKAGKLSVPGEQLAAGLYDRTEELAEAAGLQAYEVSNYARRGAECRHNLIYWRAGDYAGVGPGAHSRLMQSKKRYALSTLLNPEEWQTEVERMGHGIAERVSLSRQDQAEEMLLMGLRLQEGVSLERLKQLTAMTMNEKSLQDLEETGFVTRSPDQKRLLATKKGRLVLNSVIARLADDLNETEEALHWVRTH